MNCIKYCCIIWCKYLIPNSLKKKNKNIILFENVFKNLPTINWPTKANKRHSNARTFATFTNKRMLMNAHIYINIYLYMYVYVWYGNSYVEWFQHEQFRFYTIFLARINIACCNFIQTKMEKKINKKRKKKETEMKSS